MPENKRAAGQVRLELLIPGLVPGSCQVKLTAARGECQGNRGYFSAADSPEGDIGFLGVFEYAAKVLPSPDTSAMLRRCRRSPIVAG